MTSGRTRIAIGSFATLVFFTGFAGDFWRDLIGWGGFLALAVGLVVVSVVLLVRIKPAVNWHRMPKMLGLFLLLATVSLAWSQYHGASALGILAQWCTTASALFLALCLGWEEILRALGSALRWILGLSLLFELVISIFVRRPILPFWVDYGPGPQALYWSRDLLFHGGQIQGILGNSNLLAMCALLGLIVFGIQLADRTVRRGWGIAWIVIAIACFALTRSSTVIVATVFTVLVFLAVAWTRSVRPERRVPIYLTGIAVVVAGALSAWAFWGRLTELFGKSSDLTGRVEIWRNVIDFASQHPVFGWGWVSYWAPWAKPFNDVAFQRKGVIYLQAHNAYLDVWLQLGIVGAIIFIILVLTTIGRSWFLAVDRPRTGLDDRAPFSAMTMLPLLVMAALFAQSFAESRMLVEAGWILLVVFSVKTKLARP